MMKVLSRLHFLKRVCPLLVVLLVACSNGEREDALRSFEVGEGLALETLKHAADQGGVDIVFSAEVVKGVQTRAIEGTLPPEQAFLRMLEDSPLTVVRHRESGVYLIQRRLPEPQGESIQAPN
ncbi:STN domain-containing protein [Pelagicoccus mobilis]|uniref:STN domain-containing protein n=1 Tax=Pelagicoccus mobilis TaxID=415221 RepID=A0A934VTS4_9BACT|nr:STN domain-containing protein [Pelagicoccus mobilis]MBK1880028.1 STN domain-containing protein [Pelagicoccus mobilis]